MTKHGSLSLGGRSVLVLIRRNGTKMKLFWPLNEDTTVVDIEHDLGVSDIR